MDKYYVKTVVESLKSSSSSCVQETLLKIRSKILLNDNGIKLFTECGGLNYLVQHLRKPNERILDLALSILGNCCLNDECRLEVSKLNIVPPLISVLKTVCRDSIVGRACKLVGNIAQKNFNVEDLHNHGAVPTLIALIESRDETTSYPTLTMAVRAIRQLWIVTNKREEMLSINAVRCIAILLSSECESAGILKSDNIQNEPLGLRKSQEELISGILKCLVYFTTHATANCAEQIQGDGRGYQCLVALTKTFECLALRCLMNLCFLPACRPLLGTAGLVPCLVDILEKTSDVCCWPEGAARSLAQLSCESVNRARLRHSGGLPLLLAAAREHAFALRALVEYVFDDMSFRILINDGLITLVTDELKKYLINMDTEHDYIVPVKENDDKDTPLESQSELQHDEDIKINNMFVGYSECDVNMPGLDETRHKRLKRSQSNSPNSFAKLSRVWGTDVYCEMRSEQDRPTTSKGPLSPEAAPMSPISDGASGFSPEYRGSGRGGLCVRSPDSGFSTGEGSAASPYWTEYQWSPASSVGPASPFSIENEDSSDSEISGRYSPVCSEHEAEPVEGATAAADVTNAVSVDATLDELALLDMDAQDDDLPFVESEKELYNEMSSLDFDSSRIGCLLVLMYCVSNTYYDQCRPTKKLIMPNSSLDLLTGKDCLNTLLDYLERCRKPMGRMSRILYHIFSNTFGLMNILKQKIILRLHNMSLTSNHPISKCKQCRLVKLLCVHLMSRLTILSERSYGVGEICFHLLRGPKCVQETLSLTLPYIVKSKAILRKYYVESNALTMLLAAVPETKDEFENYVTALAKLSTNIRIINPKFLENRFLDYFIVSYDPILDGLLNEEIVTFELDDMSTVTANRTFLCQNSEVFSAMLKGCFKESIEVSVKIKNVTKEGFEYLLTLLQCGLNNSKCEVKVFPMANKLETNLEALLLADRFLFEKLKVLLNSAIIQFQMTPDTADKIYAWSLSEGMGVLCVESVAYLLTQRMCMTDRSQAFRNILDLEYKEQWLDDIKTIIMRQLEM